MRRWRAGKSARGHGGCLGAQLAGVQCVCGGVVALFLADGGMGQHVRGRRQLCRGQQQRKAEQPVRMAPRPRKEETAAHVGCAAIISRAPARRRAGSGCRCTFTVHFRLGDVSYIAVGLRYLGFAQQMLRLVTLML